MVYNINSMHASLKIKHGDPKIQLDLEYAHYVDIYACGFWSLGKLLDLVQ